MFWVGNESRKTFFLIVFLLGFIALLWGSLFAFSFESILELCCIILLALISFMLLDSYSFNLNPFDLVKVDFNNSPDPKMPSLAFNYYAPTSHFSKRFFSKLFFPAVGAFSVFAFFFYLFSLFPVSHFFNSFLAKTFLIVILGVFYWNIYKAMAFFWSSVKPNLFEYKTEFLIFSSTHQSCTIISQFTFLFWFWQLNALGFNFIFWWFIPGPFFCCFVAF